MLIIKHWLFLFICLSLTYYSVRNENIQTRKVQEEKYRLESSQQLHCWYLQIMKYWNQCVSLCEILIPFWCHRNYVKCTCNIQTVTNLCVLEVASKLANNWGELPRPNQRARSVYFVLTVSELLSINYRRRLQDFLHLWIYFIFKLS
jgi:hypothetical protein